MIYKIRRCRTVAELKNKISSKTLGTLKVWDILENQFDKKGAYLNFGDGRYYYVSRKSWKLIRDYIVDHDNIRYKLQENYKYFYK